MTTIPSNSSDIIIVGEEELGLRLDKLLSNHFPNYSRTYFQNLIENSLVLVNGATLKKREKPNLGDEIEICFALTQESSLEPEAIPLDILFEDEYLIAINKPAGMVVHPAPGHPCHTFVNALLHHCSLTTSPDNLRPGIVHRLDKDTSGVLLAAKTPEVHMHLVNLFSTRQIAKTYMTVCVGNPGNTIIDAPIGRHPARRKEMAVVEGGKEAISRFKLIHFDGELSLVEVELITGRTHQIRVHLKHNKTPVLGDQTYGYPNANAKHGAERQLLHARHLQLTHPITKVQLQFTAPFPKDFEEVSERILRKK